MKFPKISVILSTYNHPDWLEKVLWGYENQTVKSFEVVIADDGSKEETAGLIKKFKDTGTLQLQHVWHPDNGFQKSEILNKAIINSRSDYLLFSDGDCIPRHDFIEVHLQHRKAGCFLSGGYFMLPMKTSLLIDKNDIISGKAFDKNWLYDHGLKRTYKTLKLTSSGITEKLLNWITPTKATWNGHNSSGWKQDILSVNGFDERMQYGGQDRELGERLVNAGIKPVQIRYSAVCLHLDHKRGYKTQASMDKNKGIRRGTRSSKKVWTEFGIKKEAR